jgi:hypothetical protein
MSHTTLFLGMVLSNSACHVAFHVRTEGPYIALMVDEAHLTLGAKGNFSKDQKHLSNKNDKHLKVLPC